MQNSKKGRKKIQVSLRNPYVISLLWKPITQHLLVQFLRNSNHAFPTHIHFYSQNFNKIRQLQPAHISPEQPKTPKKPNFFLIYHYRRFINPNFPCLINLKFIRHLLLIPCRIFIKNFSQFRSQQITQTLLQIPKRHFLSINSVLHNGIS